MSEKFLQKATIEGGIIPVNLATAANNGDWVSLENYEYCVAVLFKGIGTAGDDPVFTLRQATDASGTSAKALDFTVVYEKVGATALSGVTSWTRQTQTAANTYTNAASAENEALIAVEIKADELDVDGGFKFVQIQIPDVGTNAQIGGAFYLMLEPRYPEASVDSALA